MNIHHETVTYSPIEEKINVYSHAGGFFLSLVALVLLIIQASLFGNSWHVVSFSLFGAGLVTLYLASTIYHHAKQPELRSRLRIFDHASIYVLIAGTYSPFTLVVLNGVIGWVLFAVSWSMAAAGIILKLFFTGRYNLLSTLMYVFMGWLILFAIKPLIENFSSEGLSWLIAGGIAYTVGAIIYSIKQIKFNHAIFHIFVLLGSISHFISIYFYILPIKGE